MLGAVCVQMARILVQTARHSAGKLTAEFGDAQSENAPLLLRLACALSFGLRRVAATLSHYPRLVSISIGTHKVASRTQMSKYGTPIR
jgi:hypothetical protein